MGGVLETFRATRYTPALDPAGGRTTTRSPRSARSLRAMAAALGLISRASATLRTGYSSSPRAQMWNHTRRAEQGRPRNFSGS